MKNVFLCLLACIVLLTVGCIDRDSLRPIGFRYKWFENTPVWPLAQAVRDEDTAQIRYWVQEKQMNVNYIEKSRWGNTLFHLAVGNSQYLSVKALLECGANPNIFDSIGLRPISIANDKYDPIRHSHNRLKIIELLLKYGANPNDYKWYKKGYNHKYTIGSTPLGTGSVDLEAVKLLMRYGADINLKRYTFLDDGDSILHYHIWENIYYNIKPISKDDESSIHVLKYLVVDLHMPMPDSIYSECYTHEKKKDIFVRSSLNFIEDAKLTHIGDKIAREQILRYLKKIGYPHF